MLGLFGDDFSVSEPADSSKVKSGASWIRDLKSRIKRFVSVMFSPESGYFRDNVVPSASLVNTGVVAGTYNRVTVNSKGQATSAENEDADVSVDYYLGRFTTASAEYDNSSSTSALVGSGGTYATTGAPYSGTYSGLIGCSYVVYSFVVPSGVRRLKCTLVGGGGGASAGADGVRYGGSGGEHVEGTVPVTPGETISVVVGNGGAVGATDAGQHGAPSAVITGAAHLEAGGGAGGTIAAAGAVVPGDKSDNVGYIASSGSAGAVATSGRSGSHLKASSVRWFGDGGGQNGGDGEYGLVLLEWVA